jgi:multiple sugar transport system permease protein
VGGVLFALTVWIPVLYTVYLSFHSFDVLTPPTWAGVANYERILDDELLLPAFVNVLGIVIGRVAATGVTWGVLQLAWNRQLHIPPKWVLVAVAPLPFLTPVGTAVIWGFLANPTSGPLGLVLTWSSTEDAKWLLYIVDTMHTLAVASAVGLVIYALAQGSRRTSGSGHPDLLAVLALFRRGNDETRSSTSETLRITGKIAIIISAASGLQSFSWSYVITAGGPAYATWTPVLHLYQHTFMYFRFGYGATIASFLLGMLLVLGWYVWFSIRSMPIQLIPAPVPNRNSTGLKGGPGILALLTFLPGAIILTPVAWFLLHSGKWDMLLAVGEQPTWPQWWINGLLAPGIAIWLVQIPVALLTAQGLATMLRSNHRIGKVILLPFLGTSLIGSSVISGALLNGLRSLDGLNTQWGSSITLLSNGLTLLLFLLFLYGVRFRVEQAILRGRGFVDVLRKDIWPVMKPLILIVGLMNTYWAGQRLFWPLIVLNSADSFTPSLGLLMARRTGDAFVPVVQLLMPHVLVAAACAAGLVFLTHMLVTQMALSTK